MLLHAISQDCVLAVSLFRHEMRKKGIRKERNEHDNGEITVVNKLLRKALPVIGLYGRLITQLAKSLPQVYSLKIVRKRTRKFVNTSD